MQNHVDKTTTLVVISISQFLMPFMMSGVAVSLPLMGAELGANARELSLVVTSYALSASIFLLPVGRLGDIHGRKRIFLLGIGVFTVMGGLLSQAWSIESVIALRFLQGVGGAMVSATGIAIIVAVFPPEERGRVLGVSVAAIYAGISCGPVLGGALVAALGWRSLYYLSVPVGVAMLLMVVRSLKGEWAEARGEPFDWVGSFVYAAAISAMVVGASSIKSGDWAWMLLAAGGAGAVLFLLVEGRVNHPLINVALLWSNRIFTFSNLAALLNYAATFGVTFFLSLYLQYVKGMDPQHAGLVMMLQPVAQAVLSPVCGRLSDRYPAAWVATAGMAVCALSLGAAARIDGATPMPVLVVILVVLGVGFAIFSSPNTSVIMGSVEPRYLGVASGFLATMRSIGMATSMTVATLVLSVHMGEHAVSAETIPDFIDAMQATLAIFCLLCTVGIALSLGRWRPAKA